MAQRARTSIGAAWLRRFVDREEVHRNATECDARSFEINGANPKEPAMESWQSLAGPVFSLKHLERPSAETNPRMRPRTRATRCPKMSLYGQCEYRNVK